MKALMNFSYKEIESSPEDLNFTIDDLTMFPPSMAVSVNGESVFIGDENENDIVHIDFDKSSFLLDGDILSISAHVSFLWTDKAGANYAIEGMLEDKEEVLEVIRKSNPNNIVPYTDGVLISGLELTSLKFLDDNDNVIRKFSDEECKSFDTEQYDDEDNYYLNY